MRVYPNAVSMMRGATHVTPITPRDTSGARCPDTGLRSKSEKECTARGARSATSRT